MRHFHPSSFEVKRYAIGRMDENSSNKWYRHPVVIAAFLGVLGPVITGIFTIFNTLISNNTKAPSEPPALVSVPAPHPVPVPAQETENDVLKPKVEHIPEQPEPPVPAQEYPAENNSASGQVFQDDFEDGLTHWNVKRYDGYNNFMRWHISEREHFSGKSSLAVGHEDTDKKDNNDTVHIETKSFFLLTEDAVLSFKLKKEYGINLEVVMTKKDAASEEIIIRFYPGNRMYGEWRAEEISLEPYIEKGLYKIMLRAWAQGSLYIDDIKIEQ